MTDTPTAAAVVVAPAPTRVPSLAIAALVISTLTLLVTLATVVFYGGQLSQRVDDTLDKQVKYEARTDARLDRFEAESRETGKQNAEVKAKLDLVLARLAPRL